MFGVFRIFHGCLKGFYKPENQRWRLRHFRVLGFRVLGVHRPEWCRLWLLIVLLRRIVYVLLFFQGSGSGFLIPPFPPLRGLRAVQGYEGFFRV